MGNGEVLNGSFQLVSPANGVASLTIAGLTITQAELLALATTNKVITTTNGTLTLNSYSYDALTGTGAVGYRYTLISPPTSVAAVTDSFSVLIQDNLGVNTPPKILAIAIIDDAPIAVSDNASVTEDGANPIADNVFANDKIGADGASTIPAGPVTGITNSASVNGTVNGVTPLPGLYGSLTIGTNGAYSYNLDNANPTVSALNTGETLTETYTYQITDKDGDVSTATLTITINGADEAPLVSSVSSVAVAEGGNLDFAVTLTNASTGPTPVTLAPASGSATLGTDTSPLLVSFDGGVTFVPVVGTTIDVPAGVTNFIVRVPTIDDSINESSETISLAASTAANTGPITGVGTISDNDPLPSLSINDVTVNEADGTATFTVTLNAISGQVVTVDFNTSNVSATSGLDYTANSGTLTFTPGVTTQTITVPINTDNLLEGNETFDVNLINSVNSTIADNIGVGTIADVAPPLVVSIAGTPSVAEGGNLVYTVTLTGGTSATDITVPVTYTGTAANGVDYTNVVNVTIPAATTASLTVAALADAVLEGNETVTATVGAGTGYTVGTASATGTITDVAPPLVVSISGTPSVAEGGNLVYTVSLTGGISSTDITVPLTYAGTADPVLVNLGAPTGQPVGAAPVTVTDGQGSGTVISNDNLPVANPDIGTVAEDNPATGNVLNNDSDADGNALTVTQFTVNGTTLPAGTTMFIPNVGNLTINPDGSYAFNPAPDFNGLVPVVTYTVSDGININDPGSLELTVTPVPDALPDRISTPENKPTRFNPLGNDTFGSQARLSDVGQPSHGRVVINLDGTVTYTPNPNYNGADSFTYTVTTPDGKTETQTVTLTVTAVNEQNNANIGALILLSNPTPPLFPASMGGSYSLLPFREPNPTWNGYESYSPSRLTLYGDLQDYDLYLTGSLRNQVVLEMQTYSFSVPPSTFRHTNPNEQLEFEAAQVDGSPLPSWLHFDPKQLKFSGVPPKGAMNAEVMVKARDRYGNEAYATFKVTVNKERDYSHKDRLKLKATHVTHASKYHAKASEPFSQPDIKVGKLAFNEQVNNAGKLSRLIESRALLDSLNQL